MSGSPLVSSSPVLVVVSFLQMQLNRASSSYTDLKVLLPDIRGRTVRIHSFEVTKTSSPSTPILPKYSSLMNRRKEQYKFYTRKNIFSVK